MNLAEYINILKKNLIFIILLTLIFVGVTILVTWKKSTVFQSSSAIEITRYQTLKQSEVEYFQYDNFYNTQVATTFANNLVGWAGAPSIVAQTYKEAGYDVPSVSLRDLGKTFTAKKKSEGSSVVDITYSSKDQVKAEKMISSLTLILKEKIEDNNQTDSSAKFNVNLSNPVIIASPKMYALNSVIAGLFGLFIAIGYSFVKESLKK